MLFKNLILLLLLAWLIMVIMFLARKDDSNHYRRQVQDFHLYVELRNTFFQGIIAIIAFLYLMKNNYFHVGKKIKLI